MVVDWRGFQRSALGRFKRRFEQFKRSFAILVLTASQ
jgi:hypothetical protein